MDSLRLLFVHVLAMPDSGTPSDAYLLRATSSAGAAIWLSSAANCLRKPGSILLSDATASRMPTISVLVVTVILSAFWTHKLRHEARGGRKEQFFRRAHLLKAPRIEYCNAIAHEQRLILG